MSKLKPPVVKLAVVIKTTWDETFAEGIAIVNGDAGIEGSRASRPLAMLRIVGKQLSLFEFYEAAALNLDTGLANEFASLKARRFFLEAGSRPTAFEKDSPSKLPSAADADVVVAGQFARRFDEMKSRLQ